MLPGLAGRYRFARAPQAETRGEEKTSPTTLHFKRIASLKNGHRRWPTLCPYFSRARTISYLWVFIFLLLCVHPLCAARTRGLCGQYRSVNPRTPNLGSISRMCSIPQKIFFSPSLFFYLNSPTLRRLALLRRHFTRLIRPT